MSILDDMRTALREADRSLVLVWKVGSGALHAVHADAAREENKTAMLGSTILGYPFVVFDEVEGWDLCEAEAVKW